MSLLADLEDFLHSHRRHGPLIADATEPAWNGYLLRFVEPTRNEHDAALD